MPLIGTIACEANPPGVDLNRWREMVASEPYLRRKPPRDIINPFTGKPAVHTPLDTEAAVYVDGLDVGTICPSLADDHELDVYSLDDRGSDVESIARTIAAELQATYTPMP